MVVTKGNNSVLTQSFILTLMVLQCYVFLLCIFSRSTFLLFHFLEFLLSCNGQDFKIIFMLKFSVSLFGFSPSIYQVQNYYFLLFISKDVYLPCKIPSFVSVHLDLTIICLLQCNAGYGYLSKLHCGGRSSRVFWVFVRKRAASRLRLIFKKKPPAKSPSCSDIFYDMLQCYEITFQLALSARAVRNLTI